MVGVSKIVVGETYIKGLSLPEWTSIINHEDVRQISG